MYIAFHFALRSRRDVFGAKITKQLYREHQTEQLKVPFAAKQQIPRYPTLDHVAELAGSKGNL